MPISKWPFVLNATSPSSHQPKYNYLQVTTKFRVARSNYYKRNYGGWGNILGQYIDKYWVS